MKTGIFKLCWVIFLASCFNTIEKPVSRSYTVEIRSMQFQPAELSVNRGDTVIFVNNDMVVHDVTEEPNRSWTSSPLSAGETYALVVTQDVNYFCTIHPVMKGKIAIR